MGGRSFSYQAPLLWNQLPVLVHDTPGPVFQCLTLSPTEEPIAPSVVADGRSNCAWFWFFWRFLPFKRKFSFPLLLPACSALGIAAKSTVSCLYMLIQEE
ncbi:hypothetical protein ILYODFUR_019455 [Ilyodon furcidens]|uniref:Uncharacterized protein n=1 Tax=Ilyodon furcidens TaxID=33524 RepID=A0ABV0V702_9TELE